MPSLRAASTVPLPAITTSSAFITIGLRCPNCVNDSQIALMFFSLCLRALFGSSSKSSIEMVSTTNFSIFASHRCKERVQAGQVPALSPSHS